MRLGACARPEEAATPKERAVDGAEYRTTASIDIVGQAERSQLLRRLTRFTGNADVAEDCLQSAFVRVAEYRRRGAIDNVIAMLARVAHNIAIDEARKARVRASAGCATELLANFQDDQPLQDEVLIARERLTRARAILNALPERTRAAFLMHRFSRLKYREIAVELDISVSAVEKHIARASLALAKSIDQATSETATGGAAHRRSTSGGVACAPARR